MEAKSTMWQADALPAPEAPGATARRRSRSPLRPALARAGTLRSPLSHQEAKTAHNGINQLLHGSPVAQPERFLPGMRKFYIRTCICTCAPARTVIIWGEDGRAPQKWQPRSHHSEQSALPITGPQARRTHTRIGGPDRRLHAHTASFPPPSRPHQATNTLPTQPHPPFAPEAAVANPEHFNVEADGWPHGFRS